MKAILMAAAAVTLGGPAFAQAGGAAAQWGQPTTRAAAEARAKAHFAERDLNHDGFIASDEIRAEFEARRGRAQDMAFERLDTNKDGTISREEFAARPAGPGGPGLVERRIERISPEGGAAGAREMRVMTLHKAPGQGGHMIMMSDSDHDGRISQAEAVAGALRMFDQTDTNHDDIVTPEERRAAMRDFVIKMHDGMGRTPVPPEPGKN
jgi:Ca2+-binding EF-hand superfamily protein